MVSIAVLSRKLPNLPAHARANPFNILALPDRWTPEIRALHGWAVRAGLVFLASILLTLALAILNTGD